ncbi:MAG: RluA family pseudouridine synthase [Gemmatales bacterium]|nr:RluA family pseudouridine synthase [Gemmatales bacterium]MDW7993494.1 RluA family pseudouridine synthase [Gemmatales bacterium]
MATKLDCQVLYEDNHLLVVAKPPGLAVMTGTRTWQSVHRWAQQYLREKYRKPGRVYVGIVHRLDKPVSGVLVLARTSKAARRLTEQFRVGSVDKVYWAVVEGIFPQRHGELRDWVKKEPNSGRVRVFTDPQPGSRLAVLEFERKAMGRGLSWLELRPRTGRTHQLRAQLAHLGHPIYGDKKYGSRYVFPGAIALHAYRLSLEHPVRRERLTFSAAPPTAWRLFAPLGVPVNSV